MFFRTPFILPVLYPRLIWRIPTSQNKIYLTFDDGPVSGPTDFVLDQLKTFKAKSTFFCIGNNVSKNPVLFDQIRIQGHTVGNHTYNHVKGWNTSDEKYLADVERCQKEINGSNLFRPPYGRITRNQIKQLHHFKIVMWDVLSYDYSQSISKERCLNGVLKATRPGSIIVFHDSYKAENNLKHTLPRVLDHFSGKGFEFESLSEL